MLLMCLMCIMMDCHFLYEFNFIDFQIKTLIQFEFCICQILKLLLWFVGNRLILCKNNALERVGYGF